MITKEGFLDYLYNLFPEVYRVEDEKQGYVLKNYLSALVYGGYSYLIDKINAYADISDPEKCPDEIFPILYASYGLTYQPSIDIKYQRKILKNIGELNRRRGTYNSVKFLVRVLTQVDVELRNEKIYNDVNGITTKNLYVILKADNLTQVQEMDNSIQVVQNFVKSQIPYNINPYVQAEISTQVLESKQYLVNVVGNAIYTNLVFDN